MPLTENGNPIGSISSENCASFDQVDDFEARGNAFREMVEALPGKHMDPQEEPGIFPGASGGPGNEEPVE